MRLVLVEDTIVGDLLAGRALWIGQTLETLGDVRLGAIPEGPAQAELTVAVGEAGDAIVAEAIVGRDRVVPGQAPAAAVERLTWGAPFALGKERAPAIVKLARGGRLILSGGGVSTTKAAAISATTATRPATMPSVNHHGRGPERAGADGPPSPMLRCGRLGWRSGVAHAARLSRRRRTCPSLIRQMNPIVARYDADASDYARYWGPVLEATAWRLLDFVEPFVARRGGGVRVLEVGAGTGTLLLAALERWPRAEFVATEPARGMLNIARERVLAARPSESRVTFVESTADSLAVDANSVDLALSSFVLQLVPDRLAALREAARVLKPSGMVSYVTWLDRDSRRPFIPADEFDEAVYELEVEEPEGAPEPHAGDVRSSRVATNELRSAGFMRASATEEELIYAWTMDSYLEYKLAYDERSLMESLDATQTRRLEEIARARLARLKERDFRWHAPVVFARAIKPDA